MKIQPLALLIAFLFSPQGLADQKEEAIRVACIGDSITVGLGIKEPGMSYPAQLQKLLGDTYEVRNFGNSGRGILKKSRRGAEKRGFIFMKEHQDALAFEPDLVICNLGINDLMDFEKYGDDFVPEYIELLTAYKALDSKPRLIVWTPLAPLFEGHAFYGDRRISQINRAIEKVVEKMGIESIDMERPLRRRGVYFPDHIHPNAEGAGIIANEVAVAVNKR